MSPLVIALICGITIALIGFGMCGWTLHPQIPTHPGRAKQESNYVIGFLVMAMGSLMVTVSLLLGIWQILQKFLAR